MGTYYAMGIVKKFTAKSTQALSQTKWNKHLNERLDMEEYTMNFGDNAAEGVLNNEIFEKNIEDSYNKLVSITNNEQISIYFEDTGTDIENYQDWTTRITIKQRNPNITLSAELAILFYRRKKSLLKSLVLNPY